MMMLKIAWRNILRHKIRSGVTVFAIVFGCVALIFVGGFFEDIYCKLREHSIYSQTGHIQIYQKGFLEKGAAHPFEYLIDNYQMVLETIRSVKGIKVVSPEINFAGLLSTGENSVSCFGLGLDPGLSKPWEGLLESTAKSKYSIKAGFSLAAGTALNNHNPSGIQLGEGLADFLNVKVGDGLILLTRSAQGSINGRDVTVRGIFKSGTKEIDENMIKAPLSTVQDLIRTNGVQSLVLFLDKWEDTPRVRAELDELFQKNGFKLEMKSWNELSDFYNKTRMMFERWFFILQLVIAAIVILSIYNTMNMVVLERTVEIGTIMALGTRQRGVRRLFVVEGALLGIIGGVLGILAGAGITLICHHYGIVMPPAPSFSSEWLSEPVVVSSNLFFSFFLAFFTAIISSLIPAFRASRIEIAEALRYAS